MALKTLSLLEEDDYDGLARAFFGSAPDSYFALKLNNVLSASAMQTGE